MHPQIVDLVRMTRKMGWKPVVNTNGLRLTDGLLNDLKKAGLFGLTFHIDTTQCRPDSHALLEMHHHPLRLRLAQRVHRAGGLTCGFNVTVSESTLSQVPELVKWAQGHPDLVQTLVFTLFRSPGLSRYFSFFAFNRKVDLSEADAPNGWDGGRAIKTQDLADKIREADPLYEPSAYLGGTVEAGEMKWSLATRFANSKGTLGYAGPKFMEFCQAFHHRHYHSWLSFAPPSLLRMGRSALLLLGWGDPTLRRALFRFLLNPAAWFRRVYLQNIVIIQPVDILPDGRISMCEGCPDMTILEGRLVRSCRLGEIKKFGTFVKAVPKEQIQEGVNIGRVVRV